MGTWEMTGWSFSTSMVPRRWRRRRTRSHESFTGNCLPSPIHTCTRAPAGELEFAIPPRNLSELEFRLYAAVAATNTACPTSFPRVEELDLADRQARKAARRMGHTHPIAVGSARTSAGKCIGLPDDERCREFA